MKYIIRLTLLIVICTQGFAQSGWKSYAKDNYKIKYPSNWELDAKGTMGTKFLIFSEVSSPSDNFRENINLVTEDLKGQSYSVEEYGQAAMNGIKQYMKEVEFLYKGKQTSTKYDYYKVIYTAKSGIYNLKFMQYYIVDNGIAYVLTYTGTVDEFDNYLEKAKSTLKTFELN